MAEQTSASKPGASGGNSTFYTGLEGFEDNFNPTISQQQTESKGAILETNSNETTSSLLGTKPTTDASNSRPSTPVHCSHVSPLTCYVLRLKHGEELRRTLLNFCDKHGLKGAFILSCVGSALTAKLRLASAVANTEGNYMMDMTNLTEIVSLTGTLSGGGHLHASLADVTGKVIGGHLLELVIDTTAEVVIGDCTALSFTRVYDTSTGFNELVINSQ